MRAVQTLTLFAPRFRAFMDDYEPFEVESPVKPTKPLEDEPAAEEEDIYEEHNEPEFRRWEDDGGNNLS